MMERGAWAWAATLWEALRDFLDAGGPILGVILAVAFGMWVLIIERYWFIRITYPRLLRRTLALWNARADRHGWHARRIRQALVSRLVVRLERGLPLLRALVALCPLLGLLGTVWGMIQVFDVLALTGSGNPRLMAAGISQATIPTMAGMVVAISGLYFSARLQVHVQRLAQLAADRLPIGEEPTP